VRVQDIPEISGSDDLTMLNWATGDERAVIAQDLSTMLPAQQELIRNTGRCTPIVFVPDSLDVRHAIEDLILLDECGNRDDLAAGVLYLPLR
jgi:hypothetical protein